MLVAKDLVVLLPELVQQTSVDACTVVGVGAVATLAKCMQEKALPPNAGQKTLTRELKKLHSSLMELLDASLLSLVVPQGWTLDLTENACCELRRWDEARSHRKRERREVASRQEQRLRELRATWKELGFKTPPALVAKSPVSVSAEQ